MFLITRNKEFCVVAKTEKDALEWLAKEIRTSEYKGGYHQILPIELYESNKTKEISA